MNLVVFFLFLLTLSAQGRRKFRKDIQCGVCEVVVHLVDKGINATTETHTVQTRFRIDEKKRTPYSRTEWRILEILDNDVPKALESFNIKLRRDGRKGKKLAKVGLDKITSRKVKSSVRKVFERMMDDHSDEIVRFFREPQTDIRRKVCVDLIKVCKTTTDDETFKKDITPPPPAPSPVPPEPLNVSDLNATDFVNGTGSNSTDAEGSNAKGDSSESKAVTSDENAEKKTDSDNTAETNTVNTDTKQAGTDEHKEL